MQPRVRYRIAVFEIICVLLGLYLLWVYLPQFSLRNTVVVALFSAAVAVSRFLDIQLPQGGKLNIDTAVVIASVILFPLPETLTIIVVGILVSVLLKRIRFELGGVFYPLSLEVFAVFLSAMIFYAAGGEPGRFDPLSDILVMFMLCAVYSVIDIGFDQLTLALNRGTPFMPAFISAARFLSSIYLSLSSLGLLLAIMYKGMGYWSLILFFIPLLVTRLSFASFLDIRNVYRKTIEALSSAIEAQNPRMHGHGRRVANYAVDIAKELGIHGRELELIGYAALLHDIGMLGVDEDSLDHLLEQASSRNGEAPHALIGAEVIEQVEFLKGAADMIRKHHVPIDKVRTKDSIPVGARIINVASHFDALTKTDLPRERLTAYQAISRIKKDQGIRFDPKVVRALINLLRKQGKLMEYVS